MTYCFVAVPVWRRTIDEIADEDKANGSLQKAGDQLFVASSEYFKIFPHLLLMAVCLHLLVSARSIFLDLNA